MTTFRITEIIISMQAKIKLQMFLTLRVHDPCGTKKVNEVLFGSVNMQTPHECSQTTWDYLQSTAVVTVI